MQVETPEWVGQELFGCGDPLLHRVLPAIKLPNRPILFNEDVNLHHEQPLTNMDIRGYFQYHTKSYVKYKDYFRALFLPTPRIVLKLGTKFDHLRNEGRTVVGLHLRRGDFGYDKFFVAPCEWYLEWLSEFWGKLRRPVLFIASDEPRKVLGDFKKYDPITVRDFDVDFDFFNQSQKKSGYPDFYFLSKCDAVAISNSSFSFAACMLNEEAEIFMRPRLSLKKLIPFDPWNAPPLFRDEKVEDYE